MNSAGLKTTTGNSLKEISDKNSFFVINVFGAPLYEKPSLNSKLIKRISVGEKIVAEHIIETKQSIHIGEGFQLYGNFIKVKNQVCSGFIHSSDLTTFRPQLEPIYNGVVIPDFKGQMTRKTTDKRIETFNDKPFEIEEEITTYDHLIHTYTDFNDCFENTYLYKHMTLHEVYHQLPVHDPNIDITSKGNFILMPEFIEKRDNQYIFKGIGITRSIAIIENQDGLFLISSLDCP
ncbi:hypothetical protein H0I23_04095 [Cellulophaga sp. HaHaR_3_176]|uniref:hypothetical protein n=1 Tax=Cellulophaga sp. HaHaR_3_176 TaxID=1942464 RepID=UPI001C1FE1AF|nr:hypothetical protein [Cellulophaga sp. HaHaR_3_176]QWX84831.1 hypothetical protein H0I23_04095 [Cellulophaga sp. HaHaR_3_176]